MKYSYTHDAGEIRTGVFFFDRMPLWRYPGKKNSYNALSPLSQRN
jgi:hypothetical protein